MKYPTIFEANKEVIKDPNKIYPGQKIVIPKLEA
ncbi:MAG: LysM peptidoglycan-binding domain-containing protein, partial [Bacteroidota bacterium]